MRSSHVGKAKNFTYKTDANVCYDETGANLQNCNEWKVNIVF